MKARQRQALLKQMIENNRANIYLAKSLRFEMTAKQARIWDKKVANLINEIQANMLLLDTKQGA